MSIIAEYAAYTLSMLCEFHRVMWLFVTVVVCMIKNLQFQLWKNHFSHCLDYLTWEDGTPKMALIVLLSTESEFSVFSHIKYSWFGNLVSFPTHFVVFFPQYKFVAAETYPCDRQSIYDALATERQCQVSEDEWTHNNLRLYLRFWTVWIVLNWVCDDHR